MRRSTTTLPAPATRIRLAPQDAAGSGVFAVWSMENVPFLSIARIASDLNGIQADFSIDPQVGQLVATSFDAQRLGHGLLVAVVEVTSDGSNQVDVSFLDQEGNVTWSIQVPADGAIDGAVSMVVSPAEDSVLLAWSELVAGASAHQVRIARLDCLPGP